MNPETQKETQKDPVSVVPGCQILQLPGDGRWKWRFTSAEGAVTDSGETFQYHYQCAAAARLKGYRPDSKWFVAT